VVNGNCCRHPVRPHRNYILLDLFHGILEGHIAQPELICTVKRDKQVLCDDIGVGVTIIGQSVTYQEDRKD
jgi:hypothetical protein